MLGKDKLKSTLSEFCVSGAEEGGAESALCVQAVNKIIILNIEISFFIVNLRFSLNR